MFEITSLKNIELWINLDVNEVLDMISRAWI